MSRDYQPLYYPGSSKEASGDFESVEDKGASQAIQFAE